MASLQSFREDLGFLVEAGLVAIKQGDEENAKKLFNAVGVLAPESTHKKMGYGIIAMHKMDIKNAIKLFEEVLHEEKTNYRAQAFLGFSCILNVLQEGLTPEDKMKSLKRGADLAHEVLDNCDVASTRQLAQSLLDWEKEMQEGSETINSAR